jgi:hypothetical protein
MNNNSDRKYACKYSDNKKSIRIPDFTCNDVHKAKLEILNAPHNKLLLQDTVYSNYKLEPNQKQISLNKYEFESNIKVILEHNLKFHVFARLQKSEYGVGVFAIRDIPADVSIFDSTLGSCINYHPVRFSEKDISILFGQNTITGDSVSSYLKDFYLSSENQQLSLPVNILGPNMIDISFFLNHGVGNEENVKIDYSDPDCDMTNYRTTRKINAGEELKIDYNKFHLPNTVLHQTMPFLKPQSNNQNSKETQNKRTRLGGSKKKSANCTK